MSATLLVDCRCTLGEGIVWCSRRRAWLWTDIEGSRLWLHRPEDGATRPWTLPERLGSFALCASGRLLLGLAKRLAFADPDAATGDLLPITTIMPLEPDLHTRVNDGRTDRAGNFVFGTLSELPGHEPIGSFYQYSHGFGLRRLDLGAVGIPNSLCFSPDGHTIYFCDSLQKRILQATYDASAAEVSSVRVFADLRELAGLPDGSTIDVKGCLWNAVWGAGVVRRFTPAGELDLEISAPSRNLTCVAFGGPNLDELAVTSARQEMTPGELDGAPQSGGVFAVSLSDMQGLPEPLFGDL